MLSGLNIHISSIAVAMNSDERKSEAIERNSVLIEKEMRFHFRFLKILEFTIKR